MKIHNGLIYVAKLMDQNGLWLATLAIHTSFFADPTDTKAITNYIWGSMDQGFKTNPVLKHFEEWDFIGDGIGLSDLVDPTVVL